MGVFFKIEKKMVTFFLSFSFFILTFSFLTPKEVFATSSINSSQTYYVYDGLTGEFLRQYTLNEVPYVDNSKSVIGTDTRTVDFSVSGVAKLMSETGYIGSSFVVDGHTIGTAAHCVYNRSTNSVNMVEAIRLFDMIGDVTKVAYPVEIHVPKNYITSSSYYNYDYALISTWEDISAYACFNLGTILDSVNMKMTQISVSGFPQIVNGKVVNSFTDDMEYTGIGKITSLEDRKIWYNVDTSGGNSGGPVYMKTKMNNKTYYTVIGVHTTGATNYNYATRITTELLHFYKNNSNVSHEYH